MRRCRRVLRAAAGLLTVSGILLVFTGTGSPPSDRLSTDTSLSIGGSVYPWEETSEVREEVPSSADLRRCFREHKRTTGRTAQVVAVGDSRARAIYLAMLKTMNETLEETARQREIQAEREQAAGGNASAYNLWRWQTIFQFYNLDTEAHAGFTSAGGEVALHYEKHNIMTDFFRGVVDRLTSSCLLGGRQPSDQCPELVLFNAGLWYTHRMSLLRSYSQDLLLLWFRHHLDLVHDSVAALSRLTSTVWKLDESIFIDVIWETLNHDRETNDDMETKALLVVSNALIFDWALTCPQLQVWSSHLPETTHNVFNFCWNSQHKLYSDPRTSKECGDAIHMPNRLQKHFAAKLLSNVCGKLNPVQ